MTDPDANQLPEVCRLGGVVTPGDFLRGGPVPDPREIVLSLPSPRPVRAGEVVPVLLRFDGVRWEPVLPPGSARARRQRQVAALPAWRRLDSLTVTAVLSVLAGLAASIVFFGVLAGISMTVLGLSAGIAIGRHLG